MQAIDKRQKKNIEKGERKTKKNTQTTATNIFLLSLFYIEKFIFC